MSEDFNQENKSVESKSRLKVKKRVVGSSYGGNYGNYGGYGAYGSKGAYSGYNYNNAQYQQGGGDLMPNRTFKDYMVILNERKAWLILTFLVVFLSVALYTWRVTPVYESMVKVEILRDANSSKSVTGESNRSDSIQNTEDFNTQVQVLESKDVIDKVLNRLDEDSRKALMEPYEDTFSLLPKLTEQEIVFKNRAIAPIKGSLMVLVTYSHPSPEMARNMADLFAQEYINYSKDIKVKRLMEEQVSLEYKNEQQEAKVVSLSKKLQDYREKHGAISLNHSEDIDNKELMELNSIVISNKKQLDLSLTNWKQLQEYRDEAKDLGDLYFIATLPQVSALLTDKTQQQIAISALSKRYKDKHPQMIMAKKRLEQTEAELEIAYDSAYQKIKASHDGLQRNYDVALNDLEQKKAEMHNLAKLRIDYDAIARELAKEEDILLKLGTAIAQKQQELSLIRSSAQIVDSAFVPTTPASPNYVINIIVGFLGAIFVGVGVALLVAFLDDRVKSAYDIEYSIGLPLLGVLPRIKRLNSNQKAKIISSNANRFVTEAFRSLYSSIGVSPVAKNAKLFLSTSTTPSEGKSFVMTNLAYTAAMNGERVIIIDADLRLPSIAKNLGIKSDKGIMSCVEKGTPLDEAIIKDVFPNVDLLMCEKRASNPMQILNSQRFMDIIEELKGKYDKVYIDTPPVGVVSDVMSIFPLVDAVMYVVKYNSVKRGLIKANVKRMLDANMPIMGVVMNMVSVKASSDYGSMYNKKYQNYYTS